MTSCQAGTRGVGADEITLFPKDLRWPDNTPYSDTEDKGKGVEDVEPELDCSKWSIVSLGKLCYSENTSDLGLAKSDETNGVTYDDTDC
jgi:hypothetical protein